jgi:broad specificity polyphosphatase/5'/3'-nucleotidase SurE
MIFLIRRSHFTLFAIATYFEIAIHMALAIIFTGWSAGFQITIIGIVILLFFCEYVARSLNMKYIPSIAFSLCDFSEDANFEPLRPYVRMLVKKILSEGLPKGVCLNVNFPLVEQYKGIKVCRMAFGTWGKEVVKCRHPRGYDYYWMVGEYTNDEPEADDTDNWALTHGYIAITPTQMDVTNYLLLEKLKKELSEE